MRKAAVAIAIAMVTALGFASACGQETSSASHTSAAPSPKPSPSLDLQRLVHSYVLKIDAESSRAPCQTSSNPWDYAKYCPTIKRMVALGWPALPFIAQEIQAGGAAGLDGYLLAIAGDTIWGPHETPIAAGAMSWATGDEWAAQYLAWAKEHPSGD